MAKLRKLTMALAVFAVAATGGLAPRGASANQAGAQSGVAQEIEQMETKLATATRAKDAAALDQLFWDDYIDIHGSGWIYTKKQNDELSANMAAGIPGVNKVIKNSQIGRKIVVFTKDAAEVVWENETYFEVPDPQQVAADNGLLAEDPKAVAKAGPKGAGITPGDGPSPNPYRVRNTRLWIRFDGQWKVASSTSTRIGERVIPGRF